MRTGATSALRRRRAQAPIVSEPSGACRHSARARAGNGAGCAAEAP
jgi:hypothetical protein